jgi:hypothetical protein
VSKSPVRPQDVLLVILGALLGALSTYLPFGVLIALSLSVTVVLMVIAEITRVDDPYVVRLSLNQTHVVHVRRTVKRTVA